MPFEKTVMEKEHFLLFPQCLSNFPNQISSFEAYSICCKGFQFGPFWLFPKQQILDLSELKDFVDDNSKLDENGIKFSNWVENTVRKGEIARYEQFLLFPLCFQALYYRQVTSIFSGFDVFLPFHRQIA